MVKISKRQLEDDETNPSKRARTETVEVGLLLNGNDIGQVIGKGGENIKRIREESGAMVTTSKYIPSSSVRTASVKGAVEDVCNAIKMIVKAIDEEHPTVTLLAEYLNLGNVIGKSGATIKKIREETKANVFVTKECIGNSTQKEVRISGGTQPVFEAIEDIVGYLAEGRSPVRVPYIPGNATPGFNVTSPNRGGGFMPSMFRGGGGGDMPTRQQGMGMGYTGARDNGTQGASSAIIRIETNIWVPKELIGKIIGHGGSTISTVRQQSTAHVYVDAGEEDDESPERKITIKGNRKSCELACAMIDTLASR